MGQGVDTRPMILSFTQKRAALKKWGIDAQKLKLAEECNELAREIVRSFNGYTNVSEIIEELIDVNIMVEQITMEYAAEYPTEYFLKVDEKLSNLNKKLGIEL